MKKVTLSFIFLFLVGLAFQSCQNGKASNKKSQITQGPDKSVAKAAGQKSQKKDKGDRLGIGDKMPMSDVAMKDVSGKMVSMEDAMGENGLIVNFSCNTCPFVIAWEDRYTDIEKWAEENKMGVMLVNSNEAKRQGDSMDDSFEAMQAHAKEVGYNCYYVVDENHKLADAMGAFTTPHIFMFDKNQQLAYKGAIDDNYKTKAAVKEPYLQNAIQAVANGKKVDPAETKGNGCSIKRLKS